MSSKIINLSPPKNNTNWQSAIDFIDEWNSNASHFELSTSGSTGTPKKIKVSRDQLVASAMQTISALNLNADDSAFVCINTAYIGGKMMLVRSLVGGMRAFITAPSANPLKNLSKHFDFMAVVPLQLQTMIQRNELKKLNEFKCIIVGGAAISPTLLNDIQLLNVPVYATYGMTETVSHIALKLLNGPNRSEYFEVLGDTEIDTDERGCLTITGSVTNHELVITNDIIRLMNKDRFEWLGRYDNIINSGGIKVHPELVEKSIDAVFEELGINRRSFIYGEKDSDLGEKVMLLIEGEPFDTSKFERSIKDRLPKFNCPKNILFAKQFIETTTGKIQRKKTIEECVN